MAQTMAREAAKGQDPALYLDPLGYETPVDTAAVTTHDPDAFWREASTRSSDYIH
jgi:hypothetical protein